MTPSQIFDALLARVGTLPGNYPTSYPNQTFTPPANAIYLIAEVFPNRPKWDGLGAGEKLDQGLLQITVVSPKRSGIIPVTQVSDAILAHFPKGLRLGALKVTGEPWVAQPLIEASEVRLPVTVPWVA